MNQHRDNVRNYCVGLTFGELCRERDSSIDDLRRQYIQEYMDDVIDEDDNNKSTQLTLDELYGELDNAESGRRRRWVLESIASRLAENSRRGIK